MKLGMDGTTSLDVTTPKELLLEQGGSMASLAAATSSVGIASLLALAINSRFKISRSLVSSIIFPFMIEDVAKFKLDKIEKITKLFIGDSEGISQENCVQAFAENIRQRLAKQNLPVRLKDLNLTMEQLATAAEDADQLDVMTMLPRSMTTDDLFELMKLAY